MPVNNPQVGGVDKTLVNGAFSGTVDIVIQYAVPPESSYFCKLFVVGGSEATDASLVVHSQPTVTQVFGSFPTGIRPVQMIAPH